LDRPKRTILKLYRTISVRLYYLRPILVRLFEW
jgi:hypothetical protein